jgi:hypothetical protein
MAAKFIQRVLCIILPLAVILSGCVTLEVGLEPVPPGTKTPDITEIPTPFINQALVPNYQEGVEVIGWSGRVYSLPVGEKFDDLLNLEPQGAGIVGITGIDPETEDQIIDLRDTGKLANFWGTLTCGVVDFNNCQLIVKRVRPEGPGPFFELERIEGWYGSLIGKTAGTEVDNAFVLAGDFPIQFGVGSSVTLINEAMASLENTNTGVRIWGQVICGVPDAGNCHIYVTDLSIVSDSNPTRPTEMPSVMRSEIKPDSTWLTYSQAAIGLEFQYPPDARVITLPAEYLPPMKLPQNESDEEIIDLINQRYLNTLCIQIEYRYGFIYISPPANRGDKYVMCTAKDFPQGEVINKTESTLTNNTYQIFNGFEIAGDGFNLDKHNETFAATLGNGYTIQYGSVINPDASYASYLLSTKQTLLAILASIKFIGP